MKREEFIYAILKNRKLNPEDLVRKKYRTVPNITADSLFGTIFDKETVKGTAAHYNIGLNTVNRLMKELFPDITITGGSRSWKYFLLDLVGYKQCNVCKEIKSKTRFYSHHVAELRSRCKSCDKDNTAGKRAKLLDATPLSADIDLITKIYADCPEDYQVDHIVPLSKGGLHHQDNLCYLTSKDNSVKSNKLPQEVPDIMARAIYPKFKHRRESSNE